MKVFAVGDKVIIQGKRFPGVVINTNGSKISIRTEDGRSLVDIESDQVIRLFSKKDKEKEDN